MLVYSYKSISVHYEYYQLYFKKIKVIHVLKTAASLQTGQLDSLTVEGIKWRY